MGHKTAKIPLVLTIRLARTGRTGVKSFRMVLMDKRTSPKGKAMAVLGHYQPALKSKAVVFEKDTILDWIKKGAKPSPTVASLLKKQGFEHMDQYLVMKKRQLKKKGEAGAKKEAIPAPGAPTPSTEKAE